MRGIVRSREEVFDKYWAVDDVGGGGEEEEDGEEGEEGQGKLYIDSEMEGGAIQIHFFPTTCAVALLISPHINQSSLRRKRLTVTIEIRIRMSRGDRSARTEPSVHNISLFVRWWCVRWKCRFG